MSVTCGEISSQTFIREALDFTFSLPINSNA
jgi:hypothetical protein